MNYYRFFISKVKNSLNSLVWLYCKYQKKTRILEKIILLRRRFKGNHLHHVFDSKNGGSIEIKSTVPWNKTKYPFNSVFTFIKFNLINLSIDWKSTFFFSFNCCSIFQQFLFDKTILKELSFCHKLTFSKPYFIVTWRCKPLIFQT